MIVSRMNDGPYRNTPATTRTVLLKTSHSSIGGSTTRIRQKTPQTLLSSPKTSRNIVAPSAVVTPPYHGADSGGGNGPFPKHQLYYQNVISSGSVSPQHQSNGGTNGSQTNALPVAVPLATSSDEFDVSKKRRPRRRNGNSLSFNQYWCNAPLSQKVAIVVAVVCVLSFAVRLVRRIYRKFQGEQLPPPQTLDFLVAGFPKSGTTTLLATLRQHPEIAMDSTENCQVARPIQQDDKNLKRLNRYLFALKKDVFNERTNSDLQSSLGLPPVFGSSLPDNYASALTPDKLQAGIKCPDAVKNFKAIHRLSQHSPNCKFVIGVRHPIMFLQSFYNYRALEAQVKNRPDIPSLFQIWNTTLNWWGVSKDAPRFEMFLSQFGKAAISLDQLQKIGSQRDPCWLSKLIDFEYFYIR
jgi:hypothetical protein